MRNRLAGTSWQRHVRRHTGRGARSLALAAVLGSIGACRPPARPVGDRSCTGARPEGPVVRAVVHAVSRYHARVTAGEILEVAGDRLADAGMELVVEDVIVHPDLPASYRGQPLGQWAVPGSVDIFIFVTVESATYDGWSEVKGSYLGDCTIAISANLGTWDTLAHEIGHMLGLRHVDDPGNVMGEDRVWRSSFTPEQAAAMKRAACG